MKFILNKDTLEVDEVVVGNSGSVNYYEAEVEYDESWNNLNIEAVLVKKDKDVGTSIAVINNKFFIDKKLSGTYYIGFVGYTIENDKKTYQISSNLKYIHFDKGAGEIETENEELPTPTEWEIYIAQIKSIVSDIEGLSDELNKKVTEVENKLESGELNGKDATINGRNAIEIEAGNNIEIEETENGIKLNAKGSGIGGGAVDSVNGQTGEVWLGAEDVGALPNTTKIPTKTSDLRNDSNFVSDENYTHTDNNFSNEEKEKLSQLKNYDDTQVKSDINTIKEKIPTQATNNNQLADKDFVNSSLNSITAFYITKNANGDQFNSKSELDSATEFYSGGEVRVPTRNDYCIVLEDETKENSTTRYIYQNNQWEFQYVVNETPLTSEQIKAINSGITLELVSKLQGLNNYNDTEIRQKLDNKVDKTSFVYDEETKTLSITI